MLKDEYEEDGAEPPRLSFRFPQSDTAERPRGNQPEGKVMSASIEDRVRKVVRSVLKVPESAIRPESRFTADLGAESIQSVELVAAFEEEFDITMDEDAALAVETVGDAVRFIEACVKDQHGE